ncbi:MAG: hypothetical protein H0S79_17825, partial [Anaerolineaceae bacterium]|nr:hypothetical protein [Anaerolineaceae bacterium]
MMEENELNNENEMEPNSGAPSASEEEITKEIPVMASDNRPELEEKPSQDQPGNDSSEKENPVEGSEWVSESEAFPESEDQHSIELNGEGPVASHHPTGDPEQTGGWWGDVPFTPIETLDEEDTQPVKTVPSDDQATRVMPSEAQAGPNDETRAIPAVDEGETEAAADAETRVMPVSNGRRRASDDIPTVPPPNMPSGWMPRDPNLPHAVSEVDDQATRVTPAAYTAPQRSADGTTGQRRPAGERGRRPSELKRPVR